MAIQIPIATAIASRAIPFAARGIRGLKGLLSGGGVPNLAKPTFNIPALGASSPIKRPPFIPRNLQRVVPQGIQNRLPAIALNNRLLRHPFYTAFGLGTARQFLTAEDPNFILNTPSPAPTADKPPFEKQTSGMTPEQLDELLQKSSGAGDNTEGSRGNIFQGVSNVLSDPERLQKIITGIALLEGTPVEDAVQLGSAVGAIGGDTGAKDTEIYDTVLGRVVDRVSSEGTAINQYSSNPRYEILPLGSVFEARQKTLEQMSEAQIDNSAKGLEQLQEAADKAREVSLKTDQALALLESGELETGFGTGIKYFGARVAGGDSPLKYEILDGLQTELATLQRMPGSGQTSDLEFQAYRDAVVGLDKSTEFNKNVLRKIQVANRLMETRLNYVEQRVFVDGVSFSQAQKEYSDVFNKKDGIAAGRFLGVDEVIFDSSKPLEKGKSYLFLDPNNLDTFNTFGVAG